jgi:hypothetical protein
VSLPLVFFSSSSDLERWIVTSPPQNWADPPPRSELGSRKRRRRLRCTPGWPVGVEAAVLGVGVGVEKEVVAALEDDRGRGGALPPLLPISRRRPETLEIHPPPHQLGRDETERGEEWERIGFGSEWSQTRLGGSLHTATPPL